MAIPMTTPILSRPFDPNQYVYCSPFGTSMPPPVTPIDPLSPSRPIAVEPNDPYVSEKTSHMKTLIGQLQKEIKVIDSQLILLNRKYDDQKKKNSHLNSKINELTRCMFVAFSLTPLPTSASESSLPPTASSTSSSSPPIATDSIELKEVLELYTKLELEIESKRKKMGALNFAIVYEEENTKKLEAEKDLLEKTLTPMSSPIIVYGPNLSNPATAAWWKRVQ